MGLIFFHDWRNFHIRIQETTLINFVVWHIFHVYTRKKFLISNVSSKIPLWCDIKVCSYYCFCFCQMTWFLLWSYLKILINQVQFFRQLTWVLSSSDLSFFMLWICMLWYFLHHYERIHTIFNLSKMKYNSVIFSLCPQNGFYPNERSVFRILDYV